MNKNIIVIGAGISGLACAQTLLKQGYKVRLIEASDRFGGRIKPLQDFVEKGFLEAGGQTIHHHQNDYFKMAKQLCKLKVEVDDVHSIYDPKLGRIITYEEFEKLYPEVESIFDTFIADRNMPDESVEQRLKTKNISDQFLHYYKAVFGAEYGASLDQLSARGVGQYEYEMPQFCTDHELTNLNHITILQTFFKEAIEIIEYNTIATEVKYSNQIQKVEYMFQGQLRSEEFTHVVICIPITQLKKLKFQPELPKEKYEATALTGMERGGKFFIQLNKPIAEKLNFKLFVPVLDHTGLWWDNSVGDSHIIIGLITEDADNQIKEIGAEAFAQKVVKSINEQYKTDVIIQKIHYENWGSTPFIEGLYSYPKVGAAKNYRQILQKPLYDRIYFAGEYCHPTFYQTIHGAYGTGIWAAKQIVEK